MALNEVAIGFPCPEMGLFSLLPPIPIPNLTQPIKELFNFPERKRRRMGREYPPPVERSRT
eukprot:scaffold24995_cov255-Cylindrotheca_fusiformis.AAC.1